MAVTPTRACPKAWFAAGFWTARLSDAPSPFVLKSIFFIPPKSHRFVTRWEFVSTVALGSGGDMPPVAALALRRLSYSLKPTGLAPAAINVHTSSDRAAAIPEMKTLPPPLRLSLIHISEPTRLGMISYAVFCLKKKQ